MCLLFPSFLKSVIWREMNCVIEIFSICLYFLLTTKIVRIFWNYFFLLMLHNLVCQNYFTFFQQNHLRQNTHLFINSEIHVQTFLGNSTTVYNQYYSYFVYLCLPARLFDSLDYSSTILLVYRMLLSVKHKSHFRIKNINRKW